MIIQIANITRPHTRHNSDHNFVRSSMSVVLSATKARILFT